MGINCVPLIADLFLYYNESQFMAIKNPTEHDLVDKFNNTYRYLDDILALNNTDFGNYCQRYLSLKLCKSNSNSCHTPFLDLDITIENGSLITKIYGPITTAILLSEWYHFPILEEYIPLA